MMGFGGKIVECFGRGLVVVDGKSAGVVEQGVEEMGVGVLVEIGLDEDIRGFEVFGGLGAVALDGGLLFRCVGG